MLAAAFTVVLALQLPACGRHMRGGLGPLVVATDATAPLTLIEHTMPRMPPASYEARLRSDLVGQGEIVRWYISRVDEAASTVVAEVVLLSSRREGPSEGS